QWSFPDRDHLCVSGGFQTGMVYQLNYVAEDTRIMGLGYAAQREFATFLRHRTADDAGRPNPFATSRGVATSILYGASQSGVYVRDYVYQGFNEDLAGPPGPLYVEPGLHWDWAVERAATRAPGHPPASSTRASFARSRRVHARPQGPHVR